MTQIKFIRPAIVKEKLFRHVFYLAKLMQNGVLHKKQNMTIFESQH